MITKLAGRRPRRSWTRSSRRAGASWAAIPSPRLRLRPAGVRRATPILVRNAVASLTQSHSRRVGKAATAERCGDAGSGLSTGPGLAGARQPGRRPSEAPRGLVGQHQREADLHALPAVWRVQIRRPLPILARPRQCGLARSSRQCRVRRCRIRRRRSRRDLRRTRRTHGGRRTRPVGACCWADESG